MNAKVLLSTCMIAIASLLAACNDDEKEPVKNPTVVPVKSVSILGEPKFSMEQNTTKQLTAVVDPDNATNDGVVWSSDNNTVANVDDNGLVEALAVGEANITVTSVSDATKKASVSVTVVEEAVPVTGIRFSATSGSAPKGGYTELITATIDPATATNKNVIWTSGDEDIAVAEVQNGNPLTVKIKGGTKLGTTVITATTEEGEHEAFFEMTTTEVLPQSLTIKKGSEVLPPDYVLDVVIGTPVQLTAEVLPLEADNKGVVWKIYSNYGKSNQIEETYLMTIGAETGLVTGLRVSEERELTVEATTAAEDESGEPIVTATCRVRSVPVLVTEIVGIPETLQVEVGAKGNIPLATASVLPGNATNKGLKISFENGTGEITSPNASTGDFDAVSAGKATVRVTADNGTIATADDVVVTCEVTVTAPANEPTAVVPSVTEGRVNWGQSLQLTATVTPAAANQSVTYSVDKPEIATVSAMGLVTSKEYGVATVTIASSAKPDIKTTVEITSEPMGTVSFMTATETTIGTQIWSDAVVASAAEGRESYFGGSNPNYLPDFRNPQGNGGTLFSWGAMNRWGDYICPEGWKIPTKQDFADLDKGMGFGNGNGAGYTNAAAVTKYLSDWGAIMSGYYAGGFSNAGVLAIYWSSDSNSASVGVVMYIGNNMVYPNSTTSVADKANAAQIRCLKE